MHIELRKIEEIIDGIEITTWQIDRNYGALVITLNKILNKSIIECEWLDDKHNYIQVMYSEWNSLELFAIFRSDGIIVRDAIREVQKYIEELDLFIVEMSGYGMAGEGLEYDLADDDWKIGVVNRHGDFIVNPEYIKVSFDEQERVFIADNNFKEKDEFSASGKKISRKR
jgi:hypothetical protein